LLVHFVGDLHQPLHVAATYLNASGKVIDPEKGAFDSQSDTHGGNSVGPPGNKLHQRWDETHLLADGVSPQSLVKSAEAASVRPVNLLSSPTDWASDTIRVAGTAAFKGVTMGPLSNNSWALLTDATDRSGTQMTQIATGGARLAALLEALWPDTK